MKVEAIYCFKCPVLFHQGWKSAEPAQLSNAVCWTLRKLYPFWGGHKDRRDAEIHLLSEEDFAEAVPPFKNCFCPSISTSLHSGEKRKEKFMGKDFWCFQSLFPSLFHPEHPSICRMCPSSLQGKTIAVWECLPLPKLKNLSKPSIIESLDQFALY